jgi:hypothetical protein
MTRTRKSGNLTAFAALMDFLDEIDRNEPSAGVQSNITHSWTNVGADLSDGGRECLWLLAI